VLSLADRFQSIDACVTSVCGSKIVDFYKVRLACTQHALSEAPAVQHQTIIHGSSPVMASTSGLPVFMVPR